jgi:hypothetical protein
MLLLKRFTMNPIRLKNAKIQSISKLFTFNLIIF